MTKHYEQRKEANKRYLAKFEEVRIRITKDEKDELKSHSDKMGESMSEFVKRAIAETMMRDEESDPKPGGNESQGDVL